MNFNMVHDTQIVYRKILNCLARPGTKENITTESKGINLALPLSKNLMALAFTVLDSEVSFAVAGKEQPAMEKRIQQLTYAKKASIVQADYIFLTQEVSAAKVCEAITEAKKGTLLNPHASATLIIEVADLDAGNNAERIFIKGPGIKGEKAIAVFGANNWLQAREIKNAEFPLGIDMFFLDTAGNILALPRTTRIFDQEER